MAGRLYCSTYLREDGKRVQLSGNSYVPMRDWYKESVDGWRFQPVLVKEPERCNHSEMNVCTECVISWSWDHEIAFSRTVAGRNLLAQIQADPHLNESVHFVNREFVPGQV